MEKNQNYQKELELLQKKTYISDLYKSIDFTYKQAGRILLFSLDDYSLEEWTEAVNYISQTRQKFETKEATKDFLYVLILTKARLYDLQKRLYVSSFLIANKL